MPQATPICPTPIRRPAHPHNGSDDRMLPAR